MQVAIALVIVALLASPGHAATIYWAGAAGNWSSGSSWIGGSAPGSSDTASFQGYAATGMSSLTVPSSFDANTLGPKAIDGNRATQWWSGANQASGQCVVLDLGSSKTFMGIEIDAGSTYPGDYGRGFAIYGASSNLACGSGSWSSSLGSKAGSAITTITFSEATYRYIKIQLNVTANPTAWWAIGELKVYATGGGTVTATISSSTTVATLDMSSAVTVAQAAGQDLTVTGNVNVDTGTTYTGSTGDLTIGGDLTVAGGTFTGSSGEVRVGDDFIFSSGTVTAPSTLFQVAGAFNRTGGTFTHNSGRVLLTSPGSETFATGGATFNNLFLNDGLVGYWKLDDGATPAVDSSGYGHSATLYNTPTWAAGPTTLQFTNANAMVLTNASSEYGRVGRTTALEPTKVSISVWIKRNATQVQYSKIVSKTYDDDGTTPYGTYLLQLNYDGGASNYGQVVFHTGHTAAAQNILLSTSDNAAPSGTWTHIVATYDSAASAPQKKLYINGVLDNSTTVSTALLYDTSSSGDFFIGSGGGGTYFDGTIDDVRVYNRAISAADVAALYAGANRVTGVGTQTLSGTITTAADLVIASGTLDVSTTGCSSAPCGISVGTNWYNYGATFTPRTGTVTLSGTGTGKVVLSDRSAFYNLTVNNTGTWTLQDRMYVTNAFAMSAAGTVATGNYPLHAGTLTKSAGTVSGSGAVVLDSGSNQSLTVNSIATPLRIESPLDSGLVGYWKFDEGRGSIAYDDSGNGYNGTVTGNAIWASDVPSSMPIDDAGALTLDGSSQSVRVTRTVTLEPAAVTVAAWVKRVGTQALHAKIVNKTYNNSGSAPYQSYALQMSNDADSSKVRWEIGLVGTGTNGIGSNTGALPDGTWTHVVGVYEPSGSAPQQRLYINGVLQASDTETIAILYDTSSNGDVYFGQHGGSSQYFDGSVDDIRIYNRGLSANEVAALYSSGYTTGSTAVYSLAATATMGGTFKIDSGVLNAVSYSNAITGAATVNGGTYIVGSNTSGQTFTAGLTVNRYGELHLLSSGGKALFGSAATFAMDGTLYATNTGAVIEASSGTYNFRVGSVSGATPELNISGLQVKETTADGMYVNYNTGATTTFTQFDNIAFTTGAGTGAGNYNLSIYATALYLTASGCTFDSGVTATVNKNVRLIGNGITAGSETRVVFGGSTCASNQASCEAYDADDDATDDGTGDTTMSNGAVVQWVKTAATDTAGTIEGFPTAAFKWTDFSYYATYVTYHDTSGTADTVYVRSSTGAAAYSWSTASGEELIGAPRWEQTAGGAKYVYVATTSGKVYQLVDNGTSSLTAATASPWDGANNPYNCTCTITTPLAHDTSNLYFGGNAAGTHKIWTLSKTSTTRLAAGSPLATSTTTNNAAPALWVSGGTTYVYLGLAGRVSKVNVSMTANVADNTNPASTNPVTGRITVVHDALYAGDDNGYLWKLDPGTNFGATSGLYKHWGYKDTTNHAACGGVCQVKSHYYDPTATNVYYGDGDGHLYVINSSGSAKTGYPYRPGTSSDVFQTAPFHRTGVILVGTTTGSLYIVDQSTNGTTPGVIRKYEFGASTKISGIAYSPNVSAYMVSTANDTNKDGKLYYIDVVSDPTSMYP
jgi:hypothetical protein